ncbi:pentapeptide repeat-containing protein [Streptomyces xinghaiensis]|uniref:pentapeptide repeat-containing protein n=1 Tax=Streptomyces xinghaiensis TaxID=1038928 RepID=UPI0034179A27
MTSATPVPPSTTPPDWPHCGHGASAEDPVGCRGRRIPDRTACLAHVAESDRVAYLTALAPGADIDHRGTAFTTELLNRLLDALRDPTGLPSLGGARFGGATFLDDAWFVGATFSGLAWFAETTFSGDARFDGATFSGDARFDAVTVTGDAWFDEMTSSGEARFDHATFSGGVWFDGATFSGQASFYGAAFAGDALFGRVTFTGTAWFAWATFTSDALFDEAIFTGPAAFSGSIFRSDVRWAGARFEGAGRLGPLECHGTVVLDGAVFGEPVTVEANARAVTCARTRWESAATLRLRHAELDLTDAVLEYPLTVAARPTPFPSTFGPLPETPLSGSDPGVRLTSVDGADAAHLVLNDIDLSACRFAGAVHLDQLRVDGWCTFATTPTGVRRHRLLPKWWSLRSTLAEEHHWRARRPHPTAARGWTPPPGEDTPVLKPAALAALYRQVRKSLEDGKNEPDAADFYYGEMEMRRHDTNRSRGERALLTAYWMLSGYGLRAGRALAWLLGAMTVTLLALLLWGLPVDDPKPTTTGRQVAVGQEATWTTETPDPVNPTGPWPERVTTERFEKALRVVINSVVFRSSGQDLTTAGTYTEMASRLAEPVLLGLAVLAVRSRVKR